VPNETTLRSGGEPDREGGDVSSSMASSDRRGRWWGGSALVDDGLVRAEAMDERGERRTQV
jgi:hypothetical protein